MPAWCAARVRIQRAGRGTETAVARRALGVVLRLRRHVVVRSHNTAEAELLERDGAGTVCVGESELAKAMTRFVLERVERLAT